MVAATLRPQGFYPFDDAFNLGLSQLPRWSVKARARPAPVRVRDAVGEVGVELRLAILDRYVPRQDLSCKQTEPGPVHGVALNRRRGVLCSWAERPVTDDVNAV